MDKDAKILNNILAHQILWHSKRIIHHDQVRFIPWMLGWLNIHKSINVLYRVNRIKEKKSHNHLNGCQKATGKIQHLFMVKTLLTN